MASLDNELRHEYTVPLIYRSFLRQGKVIYFEK